MRKGWNPVLMPAADQILHSRQPSGKLWKPLAYFNGPGCHAKCSSYIICRYQTEHLILSEIKVRRLITRVYVISEHLSRQPESTPKVSGLSVFMPTHHP
jgi:hypothetical protein